MATVLTKVSAQDADDLLSDEEIGCVLESIVIECTRLSGLESPHDRVEVKVLDPVAITGYLLGHQLSKKSFAAPITHTSLLRLSSHAFRLV